MKSAARRSLHARMQFQQILKVASLYRQLLDRLIRKHAIQRRIRGVGERAFSTDLHDLGDGSSLQLEIDARVSRHFESELRADGLLESRSLGRDGIHPGLKIGRDILSRVGRHQLAAYFRPDIGDRDFGAGDHGAALVRHRA